MKLWTVSLALLFPLACGDGRTDVVTGADADPNAPDADLTIPDADPNAPDADPNAPDADPNAPDLVGPNIVIVNPTAGALVGPFVNIVADISDDSTIVTPVIATWGIGLTSLAEVELVYQSGDRYSAPYDTTQLRAAVEANFTPPLPQLVNPSLTVRAADTEGNESVVGVQVVMDYTPPLLSLDPPFVREGTFVAGVFECSKPFDPLGDDAVNDLETYWQLSEIRAMVRDLGNGGRHTSEIVTFKAGIDPSTVQLFVLGTPTANSDALVVDLDGDGGECDDINPAYLQPNNSVLVLNLAGVSANGASHFIADIGETPDFVYPDGGPWEGCTVPSDTPDPPDPVCQLSSPLTRIIEDPLDPEPIIYGIPPFSDLVCLGAPFDSVANGIADGWSCIAVRAVDHLGNVGVSRPIRVCFDWDANQSDSCSDPGVPGVAPFDCLGGYDLNTSMIDDAATCVTDGYLTGSVIKLP